MMAALFDITAAQSKVDLDNNLRGEVSFTVTNTSGSFLRGRAIIAALESTSPNWLRLEGQAEHNFEPGGIRQYDVQIAVPSSVPAGSYLLRMDMVDIRNPDDLFTLGPVVRFDVTAAPPPPPPPPPPAEKGYVATAAGAIIGAVVAFVAGLILLSPLFLGDFTFPIVVWIGGSLGVFIALKIRKLDWQLETAGIFAAAAFVTIVLPGLYLRGDAIIIIWIILVIVLGLAARAGVLRWKTGAF
jgi:hypothetical protein